MAQAILFDLDGTLIDTSQDLATALNRLRHSKGLAPLPYHLIRQQVSHGALALVQLGFQDAPEWLNEQQTPMLRQALLDFYEADICIETDLFPGLSGLIQYLDQNEIPWGIVTNKPRYLSESLLQHLQILSNCHVLVCPEDTPNKKPAPDPLLLACDFIKRSAQQCLYIGDHLRDIESAKAANMPSIAAAYGFLTADDHPQDWQADHIFYESEVMADWLMAQSTKN